MKTTTIILIILLCLSSIVICYDIDKRNQPNVYEYLSDGKYFAPLTEEQSRLEGEREYWRDAEIEARNKQGELEVQILNLNEENR